MLFCACCWEFSLQSKAPTSQWIRVRATCSASTPKSEPWLPQIVPSRGCSSGMTAAHAVQFDEAQRLCRLFACRGGWRGCREVQKCANSSLRACLVRKLGDGRSCCGPFQHAEWTPPSISTKAGPNTRAAFGQAENAKLLDRTGQSAPAHERRAALPVRWEFSDCERRLLDWMEKRLLFKSIARLQSTESTVKQCSDNSILRAHEWSSGSRPPDQDNDVATGGSCAASTVEAGGCRLLLLLVSRTVRTSACLPRCPP
uniref:C-type lectin domain-containing protein n=1 Tax=Macrostomum lignano TaxID=282301 RepID=A0A1I8FHA9_9PLAT